MLTLSWFALENYRSVSRVKNWSGRFIDTGNTKRVNETAGAMREATLETNKCLWVPDPAVFFSIFEFIFLNFIFSCSHLTRRIKSVSSLIVSFFSHADSWSPWGNVTVPFCRFSCLRKSLLVLRFVFLFSSVFFSCTRVSRDSFEEGRKRGSTVTLTLGSFSSAAS